MSYIPLLNRAVIVLHGPDTKNFLQGVITNDISKLGDQKAIYSLLLNPQGKYLYDFFLIEHGKYILLECEKIHLQQIIEKLNLLKTYMKVRIKDISASYKIGVLFNSELAECISLPVIPALSPVIPLPDTGIQEKCVDSSFTSWNDIIFQDPRHISLGTRIIHKDQMKEPTGSFAEYELTRIQNLIPDGSKDMVQNSSFPLQYLIDKANGISFNKGCYIGQEVVNRMNRQEILRRKLYLVKGDDVLPSIGTKVVNANNEEIGELRSSINNIGLALLNTVKDHVDLYIDKVRVVDLNS